MKVGVISAYPPSYRGLSQYAWHFVQAFARHSAVREVVVLADRLPSAPRREKAGKVTVTRCWREPDLTAPARILAELRRQRPDVLWFNLHFTTFCDTEAESLQARICNLIGLSLPTWTRLLGWPTCVTLHNFPECVARECLGLLDFQPSGVNRLGAALALRGLLGAHRVCVLLPSFAVILREKYGARNVECIPLGLPGTPVAEPAPNGRPRILAFGKFGAGKRLELLTAAFRDLAADDPEVELVVAGQDHPRHPGYLQRMEQECRDLPQATFLGYVPEEQVPTVFRTSAVLAMPYTTTTGASGVLMQACMYGIPAVAADLPTLREMADQYGLALRFFPPGDQESLKCVLRELLAAPAQRMAMARHNLERVRADSLPAIADRYVALFRELIEEVRCGRKALPECRHGEGVPFGDDLGLIPAQEKPKRTL